jgi:hypothetical protein
MADWNPGKKDANYSYNERTFDGAAAMWLRRSAEEAPEVGTYNYDNVQEVESYGADATDMNDFSSQWSTTLYGEQLSSKGQKSENASVHLDTLLNDAWFCIMIGDIGKLTSLLERARLMGIPYPSDHKLKNMFGETTLWERIHDTEFKISGGDRDNVIRILSNYHVRF